MDEIFQRPLRAGEAENARFAVVWPDGDSGASDGDPSDHVLDHTNGDAKAEDQLEAADHRTQRHALDTGVRDFPTANGQSHINPAFALSSVYGSLDNATTIDRSSVYVFAYCDELLPLATVN